MNGFQGTRMPVEPLQHHPPHPADELTHEHGGRRGGTARQQLCRDRRPVGVRVAVVQIEAHEAGAGPGFDDRTHGRAGVTEHG